MPTVIRMAGCCLVPDTVTVTSPPSGRGAGTRSSSFASVVARRTTPPGRLASTLALSSVPGSSPWFTAPLPVAWGSGDALTVSTITPSPGVAALRSAGGCLAGSQNHEPAVWLLSRCLPRVDPDQGNAGVSAALWSSQPAPETRSAPKDRRPWQTFSAHVPWEGETA